VCGVGESVECASTEPEPCCLEMITVSDNQKQRRVTTRERDVLKRRKHSNMHTHTRTRTRTHARTNTHTHTHTHTHACRDASKRRRHSNTVMPQLKPKARTKACRSTS
jgi:hypothetical protein